MSLKKIALETYGQFHWRATCKIEKMNESGIIILLNGRYYKEREREREREREESDVNFYFGSLKSRKMMIFSSALSASNTTV